MNILFSLVVVEKRGLPSAMRQLALMYANGQGTTPDMDKAVEWMRKVLSCFILSCFILSCFVLSCLVLSCLVLSCLVLAWLGLAFLFLSFLVLPCLALTRPDRTNNTTQAITTHENTTQETATQENKITQGVVAAQLHLGCHKVLCVYYAFSSRFMSYNYNIVAFI